MGTAASIFSCTLIRATSVRASEAISLACNWRGGDRDLVSTGNDVSVGKDDPFAGIDHHTGAGRSHLTIGAKIACARGLLRPLTPVWRGIRREFVRAALDRNADNGRRYLLEKRGEREGAAGLFEHRQRDAGIGVCAFDGQRET